ncbi:MAG: hypothetical protein Q8N88_06495 [Nanoarchaeota archaeon]|nr:hypothetical protein [Nanoarchaeota archaeon]
MKKIIAKIKSMGLNKFLIPLIVILIVVAVAQGLYSNKGVSAKKAGEIAVNYINNALAGQATAVLTEDPVKQDGVYKLKLKIGEQAMDSYITIDGKMIFPNGIEIKEDTASTDNTSNTDNGNATSDIPQKDKTVADLFVMSFCPYGNQAEEIMMPVVDLLKDKTDIKLHYVIYENYQGGGADYCMSSGKYCSMHGIQELNQDIRELCVQKYQGDKFWNFVKQINASCTSQNVDTCWEGVALTAGINTNKIKACQKDEAVVLLQSEVDLGKKYEVSGSPQLIINDVEFSGDRSAEGYKTAICSGFNIAPTECSTSLGTDSGATPTGGCE